MSISTAIALLMVGLLLLTGAALYVFISVVIDIVLPTDPQERARDDAEELINSANYSLAQRTRLSDGGPVWQSRDFL